MKISFLFDMKLLKFIFVGMINTIVGSIIMFSLYNIFNISYWISSACNYIFTSILSFILNKYFTFNIQQISFLMIIKFIINIIFCYLFAYGIARSIINYFLLNSTQIFRENIALFNGMCIFTGLNYLGQRFFVFSREKN